MNATVFLLSKVEDLFLLFAKKASAFNSWFENAEEDLTDPVRCNSVEEIRVSSLTEQAGISLFFIFLVANLALRTASAGDLTGDVRGETHDFDSGAFLSRINCMLLIPIINVIFSYYSFEISGFARWPHPVPRFSGPSGRRHHDVEEA